MSGAKTVISPTVPCMPLILILLLKVQHLVSGKQPDIFKINVSLFSLFCISLKQLKMAFLSSFPTFHITLRHFKVKIDLKKT
jgi:uncharacterized protein YqgC (DUF456 family)